MKEKLLKDPVAIFTLLVMLGGWLVALGMQRQQFQDVREDLRTLKGKIDQVSEQFVRQDERIKAQDLRLNRLDKE